MRNTTVIVSAVSALIVFGVLCFLFVFGGLAPERGNDGSRADSAKSAAAKLSRDLERKRSELGHSYAALSDLLASQKGYRLKLKIWSRDATAEEIESFVAECKKTLESLEKSRIDLNAQVAECDAQSENVAKRERAVAARQEKTAERIENFKTQMGALVAEYQKLRAEYAGTPTFRRKDIEKRLRACEENIRKKQDEAAKLKETEDSLAAKLRALSGEGKSLAAKREKTLKAIAEAGKDVDTCRTVIEKAEACIAVMREISDINAQRLGLEESGADKSIVPEH